jgi:Flp pilus assembly protein TadD
MHPSFPDVTANSNVSEFAKLSAEIHNIIGTRCADEEKYNEALYNFNKAIDLNPNYASAYFNRGTVRVELGDVSGARTDFINAQKLNFESFPGQ